MKTAPLATEPVQVYVSRMLLLSAPDRLIELPRDAYRRVRPMTRWRLFLDCLRHPVIAFAAWRQQPHEPALTDGQRTLLWVALLHGVVAAFLT